MSMPTSYDNLARWIRLRLDVIAATRGGYIGSGDLIPKYQAMEAADICERLLQRMSPYVEILSRVPTWEDDDAQVEPEKTVDEPTIPFDRPAEPLDDPKVDLESDVAVEPDDGHKLGTKTKTKTKTKK